MSPSPPTPLVLAGCSPVLGQQPPSHSLLVSAPPWGSIPGITVPGMTTRWHPSQLPVPRLLLCRPPWISLLFFSGLL